MGEERIYGMNTSIIHETSTSCIYQMDCDTTMGYMKCYHLFPGIDVAYTTFTASYCKMRNKALPNILEIAYCYSGRFECKYKNDYFTYMGEGDFAVSVLSPEQEPAMFPIGNYEGIAIIIDLEVAGRDFSVVEGIDIDFEIFKNKFCANHCCIVSRANIELSHAFEAIYKLNGKKDEIGFIRLKVLEIFYLLTKIIPEEKIKVSNYYSRKQIEKIKSLRNDIVECLNSKETLKSMAHRYNMSLTSMKECFKDVYGKPIYTFRKEFKMQKATQLLRETNYTILEIAGQLGYENPNKFSTAFKKVIGETPSEYRKQKK